MKYHHLKKWHNIVVTTLSENVGQVSLNKINPYLSLFLFLTVGNLNMSQTEISVYYLLSVTKVMQCIFSKVCDTINNLSA